MKKILCFLLIISFSMCGCVRTYIRSSLNPTYQGKQYRDILVFANLSDIESQQTVEDTVAQKLYELGVDATPSYKIFFQGNEYTKAERRKIITDNGFDAVLFIQFTDSYTTQTYVPQTTTTYGRATQTYSGFDYSEKTYQSGGYYLSRPNFVIRTRLQETNKFETVWISDANSHGCAICSFGRIMGSFADTMGDQLANDDVLGKREQIKNADSK